MQAPTDRTREPTEEERLLRAVARLNSNLLGVAVGIVFGGLLFFMTIFLVVKGGPHPGPHLSLLSQYFFGYSVSVVGAFVGFFYASIVGYVAGYVIGKLYNRIVSFKNP